MWVKDKFKYWKINILKDKMKLIVGFLNETTKSDYLAWREDDKKSLTDWFVEESANFILKTIIYVIAGSALTYALSSYNIIPFTVRLCLANSVLIWLSLRLVEKIKVTT